MSHTKLKSFLHSLKLHLLCGDDQASCPSSPVCWTSLRHCFGFSSPYTLILSIATVTVYFRHLSTSLVQDNLSESYWKLVPQYSTPLILPQGFFDHTRDFCRNHHILTNVQLRRLGNSCMSGQRLRIEVKGWRIHASPFHTSGDGFWEHPISPEAWAITHPLQWPTQ